MYRKIMVIAVSEAEEQVLGQILKIVENYAVMQDVPSTPTVLSFPNLDIHLKEQKIYLNGKGIFLNRHEFDTLVYIAKHPGWVRSKEQIYEAVWTEEVMDYENAVMWCISQLRKKLEPDPDRLQYIHTVKGVGYKFEYHPISE